MPAKGAGSAMIKVRVATPIIEAALKLKSKGKHHQSGVQPPGHVIRRHRSKMGKEAQGAISESIA